MASYVGTTSAWNFARFQTEGKVRLRAYKFGKSYSTSSFKKVQSHNKKFLPQLLRLEKTSWLNEILEMVHSFSRSPVYQIAAVLSTKIMASVKKVLSHNKTFMPQLLSLEQTIQLKERIKTVCLSFSRSPVYQITAVFSATIIALV